MPAIHVGRPVCPNCAMRMIVVKGYDEKPSRRTFECLRCGHVDDPAAGAA